MRENLRRPLVPLEFTEKNKKVALVNELLMDENSFVYIKRADGSFPSIQDIIIEYLGGSMVFRGFVNTRAELDSKINLTTCTNGDMYIVKTDETYLDKENNTNIEYIVMTNPDTGEKYWECLGALTRGVDDTPIENSTKFLTSNAVWNYINKHFIHNIKWDDETDELIFKIGAEDGSTFNTTDQTKIIGGSRKRKVYSVADSTKKAYLTGTTSSITNNGTLIFDSGVYIGTTPGELNSKSFKTKHITVYDTEEDDTTKTIITSGLLSTGSKVSVNHDYILNVLKDTDGNYTYKFSDSGFISNGVSNSFKNAVNMNSTLTVGGNTLIRNNIRTTVGLHVGNVDDTNNYGAHAKYNNSSIQSYDTDGKSFYKFSINPDGGDIVLGSNKSASYNLTVYNSTILDGINFTIKSSKDLLNTASIETEKAILGMYDSNGIITITTPNTNSEAVNVVELFGSDRTSAGDILRVYGNIDQRSGYVNIHKNTAMPLDLTNPLQNPLTIGPPNFGLIFNYNSIYAGNTLNIRSKSRIDVYSDANTIGIGVNNTSGVSSVHIGNDKSNVTLGSSSGSSGNGWTASNISINLHGTVKVSDTVHTVTSEMEDIDDLYDYLTALKKDLSEGIQSVNSALTTLGGGLSEVTDATKLKELTAAVLDLEPQFKTQYDGQKTLLYSTINGVDYNSNVAYLAVSTNNVTLNYTTNKGNTSNSRSILSGFWNGASYILRDPSYQGGNTITSVSTSSLATITPDITDKTIISSGYRYYFPNNVVVSSLGGNAVAADVMSDKTFSSNNVGRAVSGGLTRRSTHTECGTVYKASNSVSFYFDIPEGGYNTKSASGVCEGYIGLGHFGNATAAQVLSGNTFTSSAGWKTAGTMANKGSMNKYLTYAHPKGYNPGAGYYSNINLKNPMIFMGAYGMYSELLYSAIVGDDGSGSVSYVWDNDSSNLVSSTDFCDGVIQVYNKSADIVAAAYGKIDFNLLNDGDSHNIHFGIKISEYADDTEILVGLFSNANLAYKYSYTVGTGGGHLVKSVAHYLNEKLTSSPIYPATTHITRGTELHLRMQMPSERIKSIISNYTDTDGIMYPGILLNGSGTIKITYIYIG